MENEGTRQEEKHHGCSEGGQRVGVTKDGVKWRQMIHQH